MGKTLSIDVHTRLVAAVSEGMSRRGPTSRPGAGPGSQHSLILTRNARSSSTKPAPRPKWPGCEAAP